MILPSFLLLHLKWVHRNAHRSNTYGDADSNTEPTSMLSLLRYPAHRQTDGPTAQRSVPRQNLVGSLMVMDDVPLLPVFIKSLKGA